VFQKREILAAYRIPPHMAGDLERATFSNIEQQSIEFRTYTMLPWYVRAEQDISAQLLAEDERDTFYAEFLADGLLRADAKSRAEALAIRWQNGTLNADEWRALENENPLPDGVGQTYYVPANYVPAAARSGRSRPQVIPGRRPHGRAGAGPWPPDAVRSATPTSRPTSGSGSRPRSARRSGARCGTTCSPVTATRAGPSPPPRRPDRTAWRPRSRPTTRSIDGPGNQVGRPDTVEGLAIPYGVDVDGEQFTPRPTSASTGSASPAGRCCTTTGSTTKGPDPGTVIGMQVEYEERPDGKWAQAQLDRNHKLPQGRRSPRRGGRARVLLGRDGAPRPRRPQVRPHRALAVGRAQSSPRSTRTSARGRHYT
jgi:hypothetical protein